MQLFAISICLSPFAWISMSKPLVTIDSCDMVLADRYEHGKLPATCSRRPDKKLTCATPRHSLVLRRSRTCQNRNDVRNGVRAVANPIVDDTGRSPDNNGSGIRDLKKQNLDDIGGTVRALKSRDRFPKKWLGQHYMVNTKVNSKMVDAAHIQPGDVVLEIGPGTGALTQALMEAGAYVLAVEKDSDMVALVSTRFEGSDKVKVIHVDFLKWSLRNEMSRFLQDGSSPAPGQGPRCKVVSNLPFNITTDVLKKLLPMGDLFSDVVLLLQDEAALRLANAAPCPDDYRPMTILVNFFSVPEYKFKVPRKAFFPQPHVDGAVISFRLKKESQYPLMGAPKSFFSMISSAFFGKRKMLRKSLRHMFASSSIQAALVASGLLETARPEELTLEEFVAFYKIVISSISPALKAAVDESPLLYACVPGDMDQTSTPH